MSDILYIVGMSIVLVGIIVIAISFVIKNKREKEFDNKNS